MSMKLAICLFLLGSVVSCSKSSGKRNGSGNGTSLDQPKTPDEALARLSPEYRQSYDAWKASIVKSCSAKEAFSDFNLEKLEKNQDKSVGLDGLLLLSGNSGSLVYSDGEKSAIVTSYQTDYSDEVSKLSELVTANGVTTQIEAEAHRRGLDCELFVFGQKVFETKLAASFNIGVGIGDKTPSPLEIKGPPTVSAIGRAGLGEFKSPGLSPALEKELAPLESTRTLVAGQLGIPPNLAKRLLTLKPSLGSWSSLRIAGDKAALWTSFNDSSIIAPLDSIRDLVNLDTVRLAYEVRIPLPVLAFSNGASSKSRGTLPVALEWEVKKGPESYSYSVHSAKPAEWKPYDAEEASECALNRGYGIVKDSALKNQITPSVDYMLAPCQILFENLDLTLLSNGVFKTLIPTIFSGVKPSSSFSYMGWDQVLSDLAIKAIKENKNLVLELDPQSKTILVPNLSAISSRMRTPLEQSKNLAPEASTLFLMGMNWVFKDFPVSQSSLDEMIRALDNTYVTFKQSTLTLIQTLRKNPNTSSAELSYALALDDSLKNEATKALSLSKDTGYLDFELQVFNQTLQRQVSLDLLREWSTRLTEIKTALSLFSGLGSIKNSLVGATVAWLNTKSVEYSELPQIYAAFNNVSEAFPESTKDLLESLKSSPKSQPESLTYAANFSQEMKDLAISIKDQSLSLDLNSFGNSFYNSILQKKVSLEELKQLKDTLQAAKEFKVQEAARVKDHAEQVSQNDSDLKELIKVAVNELWSKKDFEDLVVMSELAQATSWSCERLFGVSSRLDCVGLRPISKAPGKLLSPTFESRYPNLAKNFLGYIPVLSEKFLLSKGQVLASTFFSDPIWSKCDQNAFSEKSAGVDQTMKLIAKETDRFKLWDLEKQLQGHLEDCR